MREQSGYSAPLRPNGTRGAKIRRDREKEVREQVHIVRSPGTGAAELRKALFRVGGGGGGGGGEGREETRYVAKNPADKRLGPTARRKSVWFQYAGLSPRPGAESHGNLQVCVSVSARECV